MNKRRNEIIEEENKCMQVKLWKETTFSFLDEEQRCIKSSIITTGYEL